MRRISSGRGWWVFSRPAEPTGFSARCGQIGQRRMMSACEDVLLPVNGSRMPVLSLPEGGAGLLAGSPLAGVLGSFPLTGPSGGLFGQG